MANRASLALLLLLLNYAPNLVNCQHCVNQEAGDQGDAEFPPFPIDAFKTTIEVNLKANNPSMGMSWLAEESFDPVSNRGKISYFKEGIKKTLLYNNDLKEIMTIDDYSSMFKDGYDCVTESLDIVDDPYLTDIKVRLDGSRLNKDSDKNILGVSTIWKLGELDSDDGEVIYICKETISSTTVNVWQKKCSSEDDPLITYYFPESSYFYDGQIAYPLKIEVVSTVKKGTYIFIETIYNFVNFRTLKELPAGNLRIPHRFGCQHLEANNERLPKIPDVFGQDVELEFEIFASKFEEGMHGADVRPVRGAKVMYDNRYELYSVETKELREDESGSGDGSSTAKVQKGYYEVRRVYDGKGSVMYTIDESVDSCVTEEYTDLSKNQAGFNVEGFRIELDQLLGNNDGYSFLAEWTERGRNIQSFEKVMNDFEFPGKGNYKTIVTRTHLKSDTSSGDIASSGPVSILVTIFDPKKLTVPILFITINVNSFRVNKDEDDDAITMLDKKKAFDIRNCFAEQKKSSWFSLYFPMTPFDDDSYEIVERQKQVDEQVSRKLYEIMSPARIADILVDLDMAGLTVTMRVLERVDFLKDFDSIKGKRLKPSDNFLQYIQAFGESECAKLCDNLESCDSFSTCGPIICVISRADVDTAKDIEDSDGCTFFKRKSTGGKSTDALLAVLEFYVSEKSFYLQLTGTGGKIIPLTASELTKNYKFDVKQDENGKNIRMAGDADFELSFPMTTFSKTQSSENKFTRKPGLSFEQCRVECFNEADCHSFSFCPTEDCVFSSYHKDEILSSAKTSIATTCVIMTRPYELEYDGAEGYVLVRDADMSLDKLESSESCAKECSTRKDLKCLSYDFCEEGGKCLLHADHRLDGSKATFKANATGCAHYTRRFEYSFKPHPRHMLISDVTVRMDETTLEECAKTCVQSEDCYSFDFCEGADDSGGVQKTCQLSPKKYVESELTEFKLCTVYERNPSTFLNAVNQKEGPKSTYSSGMGTGFGVLFFFVGTAAGILAVFAFSWFRKSS